MTPLFTEVRRYAERRWFSGTKQESNRLYCGMTNPELRWEVVMPLLAADPVNVLPEQREVLEQLVRAHSTPQQLAVRAQGSPAVWSERGLGRRFKRNVSLWHEPRPNKKEARWTA